MAVNIYLKRSSTASKRPTATGLAAGELAINYDAATGGLFYCNTAGGVVKIGPAEISTTAPNSAPAGSTGNSAGEFWFNPTGSGTLQIWDGTAWRPIGASAAVPQATPLAVGTVYGFTPPGGLPYHTFYGWCAGAAMTATAQENTAIGFQALSTSSTGNENVAVGQSALRLSVGQSYNVAIGRWAGCQLASGNHVAIGRNTMICAGITGEGQVAVGSMALEGLTTGTGNTAVGFCVSRNNSTASFNTGVGFQALANNITGGCNTAVGQGALSQGTSHTFNVGVGNAAGGFGPSTCGTYIGFQAGLRVTGIDNTAVGACSLATGASMSGGLNTVLGARSAKALTTGSSNVIIGVNTGMSVTTGTCNILIGTSAGGGLINTGNNNVIIGTQANAIGPANNTNNSTIIGHNINVASVDAAVVIANGLAGRAIFAGAAPASWTFVSDGRLKENVEDLTLGTDYIKKVRPVTFTWKECEGNHESVWGVKAAGFIAQDLLSLEEEFDARYLDTVNDGNPDCYMVGKENLIAPLVKAVQELTARVEQLEAQLSAQG